MNDWDVQCLDQAISEAEVGLTEGGIPIGAVLATADDVLGKGHNRRIQLGSPIRHGEMDALEVAGRQPASTYRSATMYTTLAPCDMCTGAILLYGIPRVVVGENRTYLGAVDLLRSRRVEVIVTDSTKCVAMMEAFIADNPTLWDEDIGEQSDGVLVGYPNASAVTYWPSRMYELPIRVLFSNTKSIVEPQSLSAVERFELSMMLSCAKTLTSCQTPYAPLPTH